MDPITAIGLVASIIQVLEVTTKVVEYVNKVKKAPRNREELAIEAANVLGLFTSLRYRVENARGAADPWFRGVQSLGTSNGPLAQFKGAMESLASKLEPRLGASLTWPFSESGVRDVLGKIERIKTHVGLALQGDILALSQSINSDMQQTRNGVIKIGNNVQGITMAVDNIRMDLEDQTSRNICDWLSPLNFLERQDDIFRKWQEGTGEWILKSAAFQDWITGSKNLLCSPGNPGTGKTVIASVVVEHLKDTHKGDRVGVVCLYCNYKGQTEHSADFLLASLLKQLIQDGHRIPNELLVLYKRHSDRGTRPTLDDILMILRSAIDSYDKFFIIADALDECTEENGCRARLITELVHFTSRCKLMVTCRPHVGIENSLPDATMLEIRASDDDVRRYVDGRVSQDSRLSRHVQGYTGLQEEIRTTIVGNARGMFLLAQLHMDSLTNKATCKGVRRALQALPVSLGATYDEAMERIESQSDEDKVLARRVLYWVSYGSRALTIKELRHALAVEPEDRLLDEENLPDEDIIRSVCCGLISIDQTTGIVRLVHFTTQEYFEHQQKIRFPEAHISIATTCLTYLLFDSFDNRPCLSDREFEKQLEEYPFLHYAAQHWGDHVRGGSELAVEGLALSLFEQKAKLLNAVQVMEIPEHRYAGYSQAFPRDFQPLWLAATFGLTKIVQSQLRLTINVDMKDSLHGRTALHRAAQRGHVSTIQLLLEHKADVNAIDMTYGWTALRQAAQKGYETVVTLLLENGADKDARAKDRKTALHAAASQGLLAVVRLLLHTGADINAKDGAEWTALHCAASNGHEAVALCLSDNGADIEAKDQAGWTALSRAAANGHSSVVQLLLQRGADVDTSDKDGGTPLQNAAWRGHQSVLLMLLEQQANVEKRDLDGWTALQHAAWGGQAAAVVILLQGGAKISARCEDRWTSLHRAAWNDHNLVVRLLIDKGADIDAKDIHGETPLQQAAWQGHTAVVRSLLDAKVDIDAKAEDGETALHRAAGNGKTAAVNLLLQGGASSTTKNKYGETPLQVAEEHEHKDVVQLLSAQMTVAEPKSPNTEAALVLQAFYVDEDTSVSYTPVTDTESGTMTPIIDEGLQSAATTSLDPAILCALSLDPAIARIKPYITKGFSMKAKISAMVAGDYKHYFVKLLQNELDVFEGEHMSLTAIHSVAPSLCSASLAHGNFIASLGSYLITDFLDRSLRATSPGSGLSLAQKLALLHSTAAPVPEGQTQPAYGFPVPTICGPTTQDNTYNASWKDFYAERRLRCILRACEVTRGFDDELKYWVEKTIDEPVPALLSEGHLGGPNGIVPVVVHGNLWSGNKMRGIIGGKGGVEDVVFDPSSCYAHSEYEIGIMRLFGGFGAGFFQEYHRLVPKTVPREEYEDRVDLYKLYHQLNHHAIFGGDYRIEAIDNMKRLCHKYRVSTNLSQS